MSIQRDELKPRQNVSFQNIIIIIIINSSSLSSSSLSSSSSLHHSLFMFIIVNESTPTLHGEECLDENFDGEISCDYFEGFEEAFISLTQLSVTLLYHCSKLILANDSLYSALSVHVLWCTLLTCNDQLRRAIAIPVENILTCCGQQQKSLVIQPGKTFSSFSLLICMWYCE